MLVKLVDALGVTVDFLLTGNPVEDTPLANSRLFRRFKVLEALAQDDQETVIKVIDAMIAKWRQFCTSRYRAGRSAGTDGIRCSTQ
jgi:hypothetical protein